jgi:hypothetical protein
MKRTLIITISFVILAVASSGCATLFATKSLPLSISSDPYGADVYVNGFKMGTTPISLSLKADKSYYIEFRKEGYEPVTRVVNTKVGAGWIVLDVLGGIVPVVVDATTGSWNKFDQEAVNAILIKQKEV